MVVDDVNSVRIYNLRKPIAKYSSVSAFSQHLKIPPIYIYNILEGKVPMRDPMASSIESLLELEPGALDRVDEVEEMADVPLLSLNQRITKSVKAIRYVEGKEINVAKANLSSDMREELIQGVLDHLEQMAQNRSISLLDSDKANLLKVITNRLNQDD